MLDANQDGAFTITDVWLWAEFIGCWPGNAILGLLSNTAIGRFFEISPWGQYTAGAWAISGAVWLAALWLIVRRGLDC